MEIIFETTHFKIEAPQVPFVSKHEGGHIRLMSKIKVSDRTKLSPEQAIEYMKLSMVVGEALTNVLHEQGIEIGIVNYQEMGNWSVFNPVGVTLHMHIFGRAKTATIQKYGDAVQLPHRETGFYDSFVPLNEEDQLQLKEEIERLINSEKYRSFESSF